MSDIPAIRTFQQTPSLRWLPPKKTGGGWELPVLQQAWVCRETGEIEWRDVPTKKEDEE